MPQLVIADFAPQVAWLIVTFVLLYILLSWLVLPRIAGTLGNREARLTDDLERAERLRDDAEATLEAYRTALAEARGQAQAELQRASAEAAAEATRRGAALAAEVQARSRTAEAAIAAAKAAAMADVATVAGEAARALVARLSGSEPEPGAVTAALQAARQEQA